MPLSRGPVGVRPNFRGRSGSDLISGPVGVRAGRGQGPVEGRSEGRSGSDLISSFFRPDGRPPSRRTGSGGHPDRPRPDRPARIPAGRPTDGIGAGEIVAPAPWVNRAHSKSAREDSKVSNPFDSRDRSSDLSLERVRAVGRPCFILARGEIMTARSPATGGGRQHDDHRDNDRGG